MTLEKTYGGEHFISDSCKAIFKTLDDLRGGVGGGQNTLFKIASLGRFMRSL